MPPHSGLLSPTALSRRLLTVLQLTRMALVFTAIADSQCELLMYWATKGQWPPARLLVAMAIVSAGLYGFGMSLNDIIDRRRDAQIASTRPLPSGRIGLIAAHVICIGLVVAALAAGLYLAKEQPRRGWISFALIVLTGGLISFYDFAGKYLVGLGLVSLGLIRLFNSVILAPQIPVVWHPLWLLTHVTVLSTVAYTWEQKRPALTKVHWWGVLGGVAVIDLIAVACIGIARYRPGRHPILAALNVTPGLLLPIIATVAFVLLGWFLYSTTPTRRAAGQKLMLYGLLWLILYDACFAAAYAVSAWAGVILLALLPVAYFSVQLMRWWGKLLMISQRPQYVTAPAGPRDTKAPGRG